jgi:hypothetical protein
VRINDHLKHAIVLDKKLKNLFGMVSTIKSGRFASCASSFKRSHTEVKHMSNKNQATKTPMTKSDAARIQSVTAKSNDGSVPKGHFTGRAQSAANKNGK